MYGPGAVSEQALSEKAKDSLPAKSVVMGDRNFGVLWVVYAARQRGLGVVLRLTEVRARKLKPTISQTGDWPVVWEASRWDGGKHQRLPADVSVVPGRLIAARVGVGKSQQWLYLFTTSHRGAKDLVELYGRRWNIETDLRSLKRTVRLHHIAAKSDDMMEKEIRQVLSHPASLANSRRAIRRTPVIVRMLMQNAPAPHAAQLLSKRKLSHAPTVQIHKSTTGHIPGCGGIASNQIIVAVHASVTR
jgi:hypothetical protein